MIYDLIIIGGGVAGIWAAIEAKRGGLAHILIIEKENELGSSLVECELIECYQEQQTSKDYRRILLEQLFEQDIEIKLGTTALKIEGHKVACFGNRKGIEKFEAKAILMATGATQLCRDGLWIESSDLVGIYSVKRARNLLRQSDTDIGKQILVIGTTAFEKVIPLVDKKKIIGIVEKASRKEKALVVSQSYYEDYELIAINGKERVEQAILQKNGHTICVSCDTIILALPLTCNDELALKSKIYFDEIGEMSFQKAEEKIYACGRCMNAQYTIEQVKQSAQLAVEDMFKLGLV